MAKLMDSVVLSFPYILLCVLSVLEGGGLLAWDIRETDQLLVGLFKIFPRLASFLLKNFVGKRGHMGGGIENNKRN